MRSATAGMPMDESAAAPFTDGRRLLSHNGRVDRSVLPSYAEAESVCDSAVLAAHVFATTVPGDDRRHWERGDRGRRRSTRRPG